MIDSYLRSTYQTRLIDPVLKIPIFRYVNPSLITLLGCLTGILSAFLIYQGFPYIAFSALLFSGYLDTIDGSLARLYGLESKKGTVFDIFCDRIVEFSIILGLCLLQPEIRGIPCLIMLGSVLLCITSFLAVGIFSEESDRTKEETVKGFYYSPGLIERTEAFVFFSLMILLPNFFISLSFTFSVLVLLTGFIRIFQFARYS